MSGQNFTCLARAKRLSDTLFFKHFLIPFNPGAFVKFDPITYYPQEDLVVQVHSNISEIIVFEVHPFALFAENKTADF